MSAETNAFFIFVHVSALLTGGRGRASAADLLAFVRGDDDSTWQASSPPPVCPGTRVGFHRVLVGKVRPSLDLPADCHKESSCVAEASNDSVPNMTYTAGGGQAGPGVR